MDLKELIAKTKKDLAECKKFEKNAGKQGRYTDAIKLQGMQDAFKKVLWDLQKIKQ